MLGENYVNKGGQDEAEEFKQSSQKSHQRLFSPLWWWVVVAISSCSLLWDMSISLQDRMLESVCWIWRDLQRQRSVSCPPQWSRPRTCLCGEAADPTWTPPQTLLLSDVSEVRSHQTVAWASRNSSSLPGNQFQECSVD